jgi:hypothetical protein
MRSNAIWPRTLSSAMWNERRSAMRLGETRPYRLERRRWAGVLVLATVLAGLAACESEPKRKNQLLKFDIADLSPREPDVWQSDPTLGGDDASFKVSTRRYVDYSTGVSRYGHGVRGYDDFVGNYAENFESWAEDTPAINMSPYFMEKSDDVVAYEGTRPVDFVVYASHRAVPASGGSVWFRAEVHTPARANPRSTPWNVAFVIDVDRSNPAMLERTKSALRGLGAQFAPEDRVAIIAAVDEPEVLLSSEEDLSPREFERAVSALAPRRGANSSRLLTLAFEETRAARKDISTPGIVVLISEGSSGSVWLAEDVVARFAGLGARLHCAVLSGDAGSSGLEKLTRAGGGRMIDASRDTLGALEREFERERGLYAKRVRLEIFPELSRVAEVRMESGDRVDTAGEIALPDLAAGQTIAVLVRVDVPAIGVGGRDVIRFRLSAEQERPLRRTILPHTLTVEGRSDYVVSDPNVVPDPNVRP